MRRLWILVVSGLFLPTLLFAQTPAPPLTLRVWVPDALYPLTEPAITQVLDDQIAIFNEENPSYHVTLRVKPYEGAGSLLTTMTAAQPIAASALPDLALIPRNDLLAAVRSGLIRPIDDWIPLSIMADLPPNVLELGHVDNSIYGLPYAIWIEHLAYQTDVLEMRQGLSFEMVLATEQRFMMPTYPPSNQVVGDMVLGQYLAAGGRLVDDAGLPILDPEPLLKVLEFYESGIKAGIFTSDLVNISHIDDYWVRFLEGNIPIAFTTSSLYLQTSNTLPTIELAPLPSTTGDTLVILDGWVWILVATQAEQRIGALELIQLLMSAEAQADYTQAVGVLPSRQTALDLWSNPEYIQTVRAWLSNSLILPLDERKNPAAEQLQLALLAVLNGMDHQTAANHALATLASSG